MQPLSRPSKKSPEHRRGQRTEPSTNYRGEQQKPDEVSVVKESLIATADGKAYSTKLYNRDATLAV